MGRAVIRNTGGPKRGREKAICSRRYQGSEAEPLEAVPEGAGLIAEDIARPWALFRNAGWLVTPWRDAEHHSVGVPVLSRTIVQARHKVRIKQRHLWAPEPPWACEASRCWASAGPLWGSQVRCHPATRGPGSKPPGHSRSRTATRPQDPGSSERAPAQAGGLLRPGTRTGAASEPSTPQPEPTRPRSGAEPGRGRRREAQRPRSAPRPWPAHAQRAALALRAGRQSPRCS